MEIYLWIRNDFRSKILFSLFTKLYDFPIQTAFNAVSKTGSCMCLYLRRIYASPDETENWIICFMERESNFKTVWFCETCIFRFFTLHHSKRRLSNPHIENQKTALSREKKFRVKQFERENSWLETFFRIFSRILLSETYRHR